MPSSEILFTLSKSAVGKLFAQFCLSSSHRDVPLERTRFLGAISGMAEYVNGSVIFCRHSSCWRLNVAKNEWKKVCPNFFFREI